MPLEDAPRPVIGEDLALLLCLFVAAQARGKGIGKALLLAAEEEARASRDGMAAITGRRSVHMPLGFFEHHGYQGVEGRGEEWLLCKPFRPVPFPEFLPLRPREGLRDKRLLVECFDCCQCPRSAWLLRQLKTELRRQRQSIALHAIRVEDRKDVERWGVAQGVFIDGRPVSNEPLQLPEVMRCLNEIIKQRNTCQI